MKILNVFDVNSILHAAQNVEVLATEKVRGCPVGGMRNLLRKISYLLSLGEYVVCAFDSKTERSIKFPEYKKGRKHVPEVVLQTEAIYKFLTEAGVCCLKINGLEADDIIYNVVNQSLEEFYTINIHSCDYDLCHNVLAGRVNFFSTNSLAMNVNANNFSSVLSDSKCKVPYNMITAKKVFCGDSSDGVGCFISESGVSGTEWFNKLVQVCFNGKNKLPWHILRSRVVIEKLSLALGLTENDLEVLKKRCDLFFPIERQLEFRPSNIKTINLSYYKGLAKSLGDKDSCRSLKYWEATNPSVDEQLFQYGNAYKSGEFHVDRNLSLRQKEIEKTAVFTRGL